MSNDSRDKVLQVWPDAGCVYSEKSDEWYVVSTVSGYRYELLGDGDTEDHAWDNAALRLDAQSYVTEKPDGIGDPLADAMSMPIPENSDFLEDLGELVAATKLPAQNLPAAPAEHPSNSYKHKQPCSNFNDYDCGCCWCHDCGWEKTDHKPEAAPQLGTCDINSEPHLYMAHPLCGITWRPVSATQVEGGEHEQIMSDLVMLVRRMVVRLRLIDDPKGNTLVDQAMDYLRRKELASGTNILRVEPVPQVAGGEPTEWKKCLQCGRENSITTWNNVGKCPNCGGFPDRDNINPAVRWNPPNMEAGGYMDQPHRVSAPPPPVAAQSELPKRPKRRDCGKWYLVEDADPVFAEFERQLRSEIAAHAITRTKKKLAESEAVEYKARYELLGPKYLALEAELERIRHAPMPEMPTMFLARPEGSPKEWTDCYLASDIHRLIHQFQSQLAARGSK